MKKARSQSLRSIIFAALQGKKKSVAATKTFCSQLYLAQLLADLLAGSKDKALPALGKQLAEDAKKIDAATDSMVDAFVHTDECFILSRGVSSAIAFECGLKLQETCYIRARAYHSSDFYHGPMAMVGEGTKVILFASKNGLTAASEGVHREDYLKCADKMIELGADLYVVTDDAASFGRKEGAHRGDPWRRKRSLHHVPLCAYGADAGLQSQLRQGQKSRQPPRFEESYGHEIRGRILVF